VGRPRATGQGFISCRDAVRSAATEQVLPSGMTTVAITVVRFADEQQLTRIVAGTIAACLLAAGGWLARHRLPVGAGYGMLMGGVAAAILIGYLPDRTIAPLELRAAMIFAAASVLLPIAVIALDARRGPAAGEATPPVHAVGMRNLARITLHCAVIFGVLAGAAVVALLNAYGNAVPPYAFGPPQPL
jgi:hypothetical protein